MVKIGETVRREIDGKKVLMRKISENPIVHETFLEPETDLSEEEADHYLTNNERRERDIEAIVARREAELRGEAEWNEEDKADKERKMNEEFEDDELLPATPDIEENEEDQENIMIHMELPESQGGFADVMRNPAMVNRARMRVDKALRAGQSNTWGTYNQALEETRQEVVDMSEKKSDENLRSTVQEMAEARKNPS